MRELGIDFLFFRNDSGSKELKNSIQRKLLRALFITVITFVMFAIFFTAKANAGVYYISPSGSDSNSGTSSTSPWKTFSFAIPRLQPGDTLLLKDGTYTASNSGFPNINCGSNAKNGAAFQRISIKAENERQAFFNTSGAGAFYFAACSFWTVEGVRIRQGDNASFNADVISITYGSHDIILRRLLIEKTNRPSPSGGCSTSGCHAILVYSGARAVTVEETEIYECWANCINFKGDDNIARRNYVNSKGWDTCVNCTHAAAFTVYPGSNNLFENNISENNGDGFDIEASVAASGNLYYGNISLTDGRGALFKARGQSASYMPTNTVVKDFLVVGATVAAMYLRGNKNTRCDQCSFLNGAYGLLADVETGYEGDGASSVFSSNTLVANSSGYAFQIVNHKTWGVDSPYLYKNTLSYSGVTPTNVPSLDLAKVASTWTSCTTFVPTTSLLKGAGKGGADIGANVLYRYQDKVLTSQPLWDPTTGQFPHGAIIPGVNDVPGSSLSNVHQRLNVNTNGCFLPSSNIVIPSAPRSLQALSK